MEVETSRIEAKRAFLEKIFKRHFFCQEVGGELIYATELPNKSTLSFLLADLPQFMFHHYPALHELGTLGHSYSSDYDTPRYWGLKESELENIDIDALLDAHNQNKEAPKLPEYAPDMHEEMDNWINEKSTLSHLKEEELTPEYFGKYLLSVLHGDLPAGKGWYDRDDDLIFQCKYLKYPTGGVPQSKQLDLKLLANAASYYKSLPPVPGLEPIITVRKSASFPLLQACSNHGCETYPNPDYKPNHEVTGLYGFGYHIQGFDELDKLYKAVKKDLAKNPENNLDNLFRQNRKKYDVTPDHKAFANLATENISLPLSNNKFIDFTPEELLLDKPVSTIAGMKAAIKLTSTHPSVKNL